MRTLTTLALSNYTPFVCRHFNRPKRTPPPYHFQFAHYPGQSATFPMPPNLPSDGTRRTGGMRESSKASSGRRVESNAFKQTNRQKGARAQRTYTGIVSVLPSFLHVSRILRSHSRCPRCQLTTQLIHFPFPALGVCLFVSFLTCLCFLPRQANSCICTPLIALAECKCVYSILLTCNITT